MAVIQFTRCPRPAIVYKCIVSTLEDAGFVATPYHALVPSFGEWGFVLAERHAYRAPANFPVDTRFLIF